MIKIIKPLINQFMPFAQKRMGFDKPPRLFLRSDVSNADNPLGKTAYYDPNEQKVVLYVTGRHPKDVMRSLSHELVHHTQNLRGDFDNVQAMGDGYAQNDAHLREMEREAYEMGNLCFRDWEDSIKHTIYFEHLQKGVATIMSTKDWKNKEIQGLLSEAWGFKMNLDALTEAAKPDFPDIDGDGDKEEPISKAAEDKKEKEGDDKEDKPKAKAKKGEVPPQLKPFVDKKKKNEAKHEDDDKEKMEEGGCPSDDAGQAMMVVADDDMQGGMEMDDNMETSEMRLASLVDRLESLLGKMEGGDMMEEEELEEIIDTNPDAEDRGRGKKKEDDEEELDERRARGRDREGMEPDARRRPMNEQKLREAVRKALKASIKKV